MSEPISTLDKIERRLSNIDERLGQVEIESKKRVEVEKDIMELFNDIQGFLSVMRWFERVAIFFAKMSAAGAVVWAAFVYFVKGASK